MAYKYQRFDRQLFAWLRANRDNATTAGAIAALNVTDKSQKRHISRRFSQLQDSGVLVCALQGTTRICKIVADIPESMTKQPWRQKLTSQVQIHCDSRGIDNGSTGRPAPSIIASDSREFEARGGVVEKLPAHWDTPRAGSTPLGDSFSFDD